MIFILFTLLFNIIFYYIIYSYFGFLIANALLIVLKRYESSIKNNVYLKLKNVPCLDKKLIKLEKYNHQIQLKLFNYIFSYLQRNIIPLISHLEKNGTTNIPEVTRIEYSSNVFKSKQDEEEFLTKLENLVT